MKKIILALIVALPMSCLASQEDAHIVTAKARLLDMMSRASDTKSCNTENPSLDCKEMVDVTKGVSFSSLAHVGGQTTGSYVGTTFSGVRLSRNFQIPDEALDVKIN